MNNQNIYINPLTQELNTWHDVQEIGIYMTAAHGRLLNSHHGQHFKHHTV
jgi:hypothetical protein